MVQGTPLSTKSVCVIGTLGGLCATLTAAGLFDFGKFQKYMTSDYPLLQIVFYIALSVFATFLGGLWAYFHRPLFSAILAFQLGILAPGAFHAMTTRLGSSGIIYPVDSKADIGGQIVRVSYVGKTKISIFECIIKTIIKRPCK